MKQINTSLSTKTDDIPKRKKETLIGTPAAIKNLFATNEFSATNPLNIRLMSKFILHKAYGCNTYLPTDFDSSMIIKTIGLIASLLANDKLRAEELAIINRN